MYFLVSERPSLAAQILIVALVVSGASTGLTQTVSDTDYLTALDDMVVDMDLEGLASQTFETQTVAAPQLSTITANLSIASCDDLLAQADESGRLMKIFGDDSTLSSQELATLSKCKLADTGVLVSYLMPES